MKTDKLKYAKFLVFSLLIITLSGSLRADSVASPSASAVVGAIDISKREKEAMDSFRALLTVKDRKQIPLWRDFVDKFVPKLVGTRYEDLGKSLLKVRDATGVFGKVTIAEELQKHFDVLPEDIRQLFNTMSTDELSARVRNY